MAKHAALLTQWAWHASVLLIHGLAKPRDRASGILSEASLKEIKIDKAVGNRHQTEPKRSC